MRRVWVALLAFGSLGSMCGPGGGFSPPEPDSCEFKGDASGIATLEVGSGIEGLTFVPWRDGDVVQTVSGGQGSPMLPVRFRVTGRAVPDCLPQITMVKDTTEGLRVGGTISALKTYAQPDGSRMTKPHYIILGYVLPERQLELSTTVRTATVTATRTVYYNHGPADGGIADARPGDATYPCADAGGAAPVGDGIVCGAQVCDPGVLCCAPSASCGGCGLCPLHARTWCDGPEDCPSGQQCCGDSDDAYFDCTPLTCRTPACHRDEDCKAPQRCTGRSFFGGISVAICG